MTFIGKGRYPRAAKTDCWLYFPIYARVRGRDTAHSRMLKAALWGIAYTGCNALTPAPASKTTVGSASLVTCALEAFQENAEANGSDPWTGPYECECSTLLTPVRV